jgi:Obg family GTPase CgtA-like protein
LRALHQKVEQSRQKFDLTGETDEEIETISLDESKTAEAWNAIRVENEQDSTAVFKVTGEKIEKFARRTDFSNYEGVNRLRAIIKKLGIAHELRRLGAEGDSIIQIGDNEFSLLEQ